MEGLKHYRATLRRRDEATRRRRAERAERAQEVARRAGAQLKERFGASRVVVFGSVAAGRPLHARSDVDLAAWGLAPAAHLEAVAQLQSCAPEFRIDVVRMEHCPPALRSVILAEGRAL